jgi:hypothetical protein
MAGDLLLSAPAAGSPAWREIHPVPPRLRLATVGPWCPLDDSVLHLRRDTTGAPSRRDGWDCPVCRAAWDITGAQSWWPDVVPARRVSPARAAAVVVGSFLAAAGIAVPLAGLDEPVQFAAAAVPAAAAAAVVLHAFGGRLADWRRYRRNYVVRRLDGAAPLAGEVCDGRP